MPIFPLFDTYVMVDWSAKSRPTTVEPQANAIWWAVHPEREDTRPTLDALCAGKRTGRHGRVFGSEDGVEIYERTRCDAIEDIQGFLMHEVTRRRRVLIGFDFAFGYPMGFAGAITGRPCVLELWSALSGDHDGDGKIVVCDKPNNASNRFTVAAELNARIVAATRDESVDYGPFWGFPGANKSRVCGPPKDPYRLSARPMNERAEWPHREWPTGFGFARKRITEGRAVGSRSVFQLSGAGSVGSQVLVGMPWLHRLRCHIRGATGMRDRCVVWPIDPDFSLKRKDDGGEVVIAEIYPSLVTRGRGARIPDREQVKENARAFGRLDTDGALESLFNLDEILASDTRHSSRGKARCRSAQYLKVAVEREEGWILGAGQSDILRSVVKKDSPLHQKK